MEEAIFISVELTAGKKYKFSFYAKQNSSSGVSVMGVYGTSIDDLNDMETVIAETEVVDGAYQDFTGYFTPSQSGSYFIGIKGNILSSATYLIVDDVSVTEASSCIQPSSLKVDKLASNSADISWKKTEQESQWELVYGKAGFTPGGTGSQSQIIFTTPKATLSNLDPNTDYEIYVKTICSSSSQSDLIGPILFTTFCEAIDAPYFEDFESVTTPNLPECVSTISSTSYSWQTQNIDMSGFSGNALMNMSLIENSTDWYFTPGINLVKGKTYEVSYKYAVPAMYESLLTVAYGSYPSKDMMDVVLAQHDVKQQEATTNAEYISVSNSGIYYFGFESGENAGGGYLLIDDISVKEVTACLPPTAISVDDASTNSISTSWTANNNETQWQIVYVVKGFTPGDNNSDSILVTSSPQTTIGNLVSNQKYDLYIKSICDNNIESALTGPIEAATLCGATSIPYTINFENDSAFASAPAQRVTIRQQFDEHVNPYSLRLGTFGFANMTFEVPENSLTYTTRLNLHDTLGFDVEVTAGLDVDNREVFWVFQSIDNSTGRSPYDPSVGFLPINDSINSGEGFVSYTVIPESSAQTGNSISHQASIVFDINAPIETNVWTNLIDAVAPTSVLTPIDAVQSSTSFVLSWIAEDDVNGSGVKDYNLLYSKDGGEWLVYQDAITDTFVVFIGEPETTYDFKVLASDRANNLEEKDIADATVYLLLEKNIQVSIEVDSSAVYCMDTEVEINWTSDLVDSVHIYISTDAGTTYNLIAENIDAELGSYRWLVPESINLTSTNQFKVEDADEPSVLGISNAFEIYQQPEISVSFSDTIEIVSGELMSLEVTTTEDDSLIAWYRNGVLIASGTKVLTISDKGLYTVQVSNQVGCSVSAQTVVLQSLVAHAEILAGDSVYVCENGTTQLRAAYVEGFTYQWLLNGEEITGAVGPTHTADVTGAYSVIVHVVETNDVDTSNTVEVVAIPNPAQPEISTEEKTLTSSAETGNQWYVNGSLIEDATEQTFEPRNSGQYTVMVTDSNGCMSELSEVKDFVYTMVFESLSGTKILMYPNPNEGTFYVSFDVPLNSELTVRLFDLNGREQMSSHYPSYTGKYWEELSLQKPVPGLYFLEVTIDKKKSMVKIIVQ